MIVFVIYSVFLFIIFIVIINYSPLVNGIIELLLRKGDEVIYEVFIGIEIGCYGLGTICLIIMIFQGTDDQITQGIASMVVLLIIAYILEILLYFSSSDYESDHPDEFVNFIGKFRIFVFLAIAGIEIISLIIYDKCCALSDGFLNI